MNGQINLKGSWDTVWSGITSSIPGLSILLSILAVVALSVTLVLWFWQRRKNLGAGGSQTLIGTAVAAAVFAAPDLIIPLLLGLIDGVLNFVVGLLQKGAGIS